MEKSGKGLEVKMYSFHYECEYQKDVREERKAKRKNLLRACRNCKE